MEVYIVTYLISDPFYPHEGRSQLKGICNSSLPLRPLLGQPRLLLGCLLASLQLLFPGAAVSSPSKGFPDGPMESSHPVTRWLCPNSSLFRPVPKVIFLLNLFIRGEVFITRGNNQTPMVSAQKCAVPGKTLEKYLFHWIQEWMNEIF